MMRRATTVTLFLFIATVALRAGDWPTFGYDAQRSGWARDEVILNRDNVSKLELKWKKKVTNEPKSLTSLTAPIVVSDVATEAGPKNLVYIAGSADYFYAIDTATGEIVWERQFKTDVVNKTPGMWLCPKGLNATPAADVLRNTIYAISTDGRLYAMDLATGKDHYRPVQAVSAFAKAWSLVVRGTTVYTSISQNCGEMPSGVVSIDVSDPVMPVIRHWRSARYGAGVWGRGGVALGEDGSIYAGTGDGAFNAEQRNFGQTMFRLHPDTLKLEDYFTPKNWDYVRKRDFDITASATVFPYKGRELVVIGGKEGLVYLMDAENMGGATHHDCLYTTPLLSNEDEWFEAMGIWGGFSTYLDSEGRRWVYIPIWGPVAKQAPEFRQTNGPNPNGSVMGFTVEDHPETGRPYLKAQWVSADFSVPEPVAIANDVVFALASGENARQSVNAGIMPFGNFKSEELLKDNQRVESEKKAQLRALDAHTGKLLYDSGPAVFETWTHFSGIAVAAGQVYAVDFNSNVYAFGLKSE
ncbi:MAG: PQQ-binding-like beta-propeller repeat protein [Acidobacteria bacterium]|nr:PQQ-binding-like beta-propeller repeat protein [Acidobacteriota bacterium]